jgi:hypothetical protein
MGVMRKARGASGTISVIDPARAGAVVARVLWFGDPWTGDWEWQIRPEDPALRKRLDECFAQNEERFAGVDFGAFSGRLSPAWTSYEGTLSALNLALPGIGLGIGATEFPPEILRPAGDVTFDQYDAEEAADAAGDVQIVREQRLRVWAATGEAPPSVTVAEAAEDLGRAAIDSALETEV